MTTEPLRGDSLPFTTKSPEIPGGNPAPQPLGHCSIDYVLSLSKLEIVLVQTVGGRLNGEPQDTMVELHYNCCISQS